MNSQLQKHQVALRRLPAQRQTSTTFHESAKADFVHLVGAVSNRRPLGCLAILNLPVTLLTRTDG